MSRKTETYTVWTCDDCNEEYGGEEGIINLTTQGGVPIGWETIDGKDMCEECFVRRECAEKGHDWSEWISSYWLPEGAEEYRRCLRCGNGEETRTCMESDS